MKWRSIGVSSLLCMGLLTACGSTSSEQTELWSEQSCTGHMTLQYATEFSVDYYDPYALITIADNQQYLLVPEGETVPVGLDTNITVLQQPFQNLYVAASSAMDLFDGIGALEQVRMTSTTEKTGVFRIFNRHWNRERCCMLENTVLLIMKRFYLKDVILRLSRL